MELTPDLQVRSAWAWPQAALWSLLGMLYLNLPLVLAAGAGMAGYILGGAVSSLRVRLAFPDRGLRVTNLTKHLLALASLAICVAAAFHPVGLEGVVPLASVFRPSAVWPGSTFYGGWAGEPAVIALLLAIATLQILLNDFRYPDGGLIGRRSITDRLTRPGQAMGIFILAMIFVLAASGVLLLGAYVGKTGPRGQLLNARVGPVWAFAWWGFLSFMVAAIRLVRLASTAAVLAPPRVARSPNP